MDNPPDDQKPEAATASAPAPEVLQPRSAEGAAATTTPATKLAATSEEGKKLRRRTYRPSHKATFVALAVVVAILAVNAVVITLVLKNKAKSDQANSEQVTISADVLSKIGVNKSTIGSSSALLTVDPDAKFNGKITAAGEVNLAGDLKLNSKMNANEAAIARLQAGNTSLSQLDVNGNSTLSALLLRSTLTVNGSTTLQGTVTISKLLTINDSLNVQGNVAIGGTLTTATFTARNLASTSTLTIGGHIITAGPSPSVGPGGGALGSNGTVSISGNDSAGVISINIGVGASAGTLANIAFKTQFSTVPRIVITPVGVPGSFYITNPSIGGFSVAVGSGLPAGGYAINYIVQQ